MLRSGCVHDCVFCGCEWLAYPFSSFMVSNRWQILSVKGTKTSRWQQAVVFALSTAATLVPEMLPAVVTANLSRGSFLLRKSGVIVNHMDSIHSLGSMSVLCSDKVRSLPFG